MRKAIITTVLTTVLLAPASAPAVELRDEPELCFAQNPVQPSCTFTVKSAPTVGAASGVTGAGDWKLVIKRGKKKVKINSCPVGSCVGGPSFPYQKGDVVTATALTPGSWVLAGHD